MKLLDSKGNLFGKVNYFDVLVVLLIIVLVVGFVGLRKSENLNVIDIIDQKEINLTLYIGGVRDVTVDNLNVGDVIRSGETKKVIGEIIEKQVVNQQITTTNLNGEVVINEVPDKFDVTIIIKAKGTINSNDVTVANKIIKIGMYLPIETKVIKTNPIVFGIEL